MEQEFKNIKKWQEWAWLLIKWFFGLLFRPLLDILKLSKKEIWDNIINKNWKDLWLAIIPIILIFLFLLYSFNWLINDLHKWWYNERYEKVLIDNYKKDIEDFFDKYEERFLAHDCWFMREVWADEFMFDNYKQTSYWDDFECTAFLRIQRLHLLPINIWQIEKAWNKLKVRWEMIRVEFVSWKPLEIIPMRFELWKTIDMDLWHFNVYWDSETRFISSQIKKLQ